MNTKLAQLTAGRNLPEELREVLETLYNMYGDQLNVRWIDKPTGGINAPEFINFEVRDKTDDWLFNDLQKNKEEIFGATYFRKFRVLKAGGNSRDRGLFLQFFGDGSVRLRDEYAQEFNYY